MIDQEQRGTTSMQEDPPRPAHPALLNIANQLTAARLLLGIVLFVLIVFESWLWCVAVFAVAAFTDWLDGYLARKLVLSSALGRVFDPLVDKVLICGAYIFLLELPHERSGLWPWMVTVVVSRELIINSLRSYLESQGVIFGADWLGKLKMGLQCAALFAIFIVLRVGLHPESEPGPYFLRGLRDLLIYAMLAATALSGLQYLVKAALLFRSNR